MQTLMDLAIFYSRFDVIGLAKAVRGLFSFFYYFANNLKLFFNFQKYFSDQNFGGSTFG